MAKRSQSSRATEKVDARINKQVEEALDTVVVDERVITGAVNQIMHAKNAKLIKESHSRAGFECCQR